MLYSNQSKEGWVCSKKTHLYQCLFKCPLIETKLLQPWLPERDFGEQGERDRFDLLLHMFLCCFGSSFLQRAKRKHAHQKDSIGFKSWWLQDCCLFYQRKLGRLVNVKLPEAGYGFNLYCYFPGCYLRVWKCDFVCALRGSCPPVASRQRETHC